MTSTVPAKYNAEEDATYLFNQLRQLPEDQRELFVENELKKIETPQAAASTSPGDLIYMRKVWLMVQEKVKFDLKPKIMVPIRNVRYSKKFE